MVVDLMVEVKNIIYVIRSPWPNYGVIYASSASKSLGCYSELAESRNFMICIYNIDLWGILSMTFTVTLGQGWVKVKVTPVVGSTWTVCTLKVLKKEQSLNNWAQSCILGGAWMSLILGDLDLFSRSQEPISWNGRHAISRFFVNIHFSCIQLWLLAWWWK